MRPVKNNADKAQKPAKNPGKQKMNLARITLSPANHVCLKDFGTRRVVGCLNAYLFSCQIAKVENQHKSVNAMITNKTTNGRDFHSHF